MTGSAIAATQGSIGPTSTGTSDIIMNKGNSVQITDVGDINLGTSGNLAAAAVESDDVCVFSSTGGYNITMSSTNGSFILTDGNTQTDIGYTIEWDGGTPTPVTYGNAITGLMGHSTSVNCDSSTNATFTVSVSATEFNNADPGTYSDTLTLLVQPE
jgi:hypothetical protein